jgi:hypothetical protein
MSVEVICQSTFLDVQISNLDICACGISSYRNGVLS